MEQLSADVATFRALARSSRRLWGSVRISVVERGATAGEGWRAWVRRPYSYRLEGSNGAVQSRGLNQNESGTSMLVGGGGSEPEPPSDPEVLAIRGETLDLVANLAQPDPPDEDIFAVVSRARTEAERRLATNPRLVAGRLLADQPTVRPDDTVPFFVNYQRMALLEPDELADGEAGPDEELDVRAPWASLTPHEREIRLARVARAMGIEAAEIARGDLTRWDRPALEIVRVDHVNHHGRPALEAVVRTTSMYAPRCSCCALLTGLHSLGIEQRGMSDEQARVIGWPDPAEGGVEFRVRLDIGTGICVDVEALDGTDVGGGFTVTVEEVDVDYPDTLFRVHGL